MGGRGGFEEEVEDGSGRLMDKAAAAPLKRRRSRKRDKATTNNNKDHQYTTIKQNVGKPQLLGATNRRLVGVSRIQERARKSGANKSTTKCQ